MTPSIDLADQVALLLDGPRPLPIVQAGHPALRRPATRYTDQLDDEMLTELIDAMRTTMLEAPGVGLAAPQVGLSLAVAVLGDPGGIDEEAVEVRERQPVPFRVIINPEYTPIGEEKVSFYEGCLSVRGWQAVTARWRTVRLTAQDENGHQVDEVLRGWPARIVQHETDHLAGRLYVDLAEMRSLTGDEYVGLWAAEPAPERAARELGFDLG